MFQVWTENNPLTYILTSGKLDATGHQWVTSLADYSFSLHYCAGRMNINANALSHLTFQAAWDILQPEVVQVLCDLPVHDLVVEG